MQGVDGVLHTGPVRLAAIPGTFNLLGWSVAELGGGADIDFLR